MCLLVPFPDCLVSVVHDRASTPTAPCLTIFHPFRVTRVHRVGLSAALLAPTYLAYLLVPRGHCTNFTDLDLSRSARARGAPSIVPIHARRSLSLLFITCRAHPLNLVFDSCTPSNPYAYHAHPNCSCPSSRPSNYHTISRY